MTGAAGPAGGPHGRLGGYRVAVLGGGGVLGAAAARACGREGAAVAVGYRSSAEAAAAVADEITAGGGTAFAGAADVTDARSVGGFIDAAADRLGGLDVLVNAFGRIDAADAVRFAQTTAAAWDELFAVDVRGLLLACQAALPHLLRSPVASIINFAGSYGNGSNPENLVSSVSVSFCAAKGAVRGFTAALARDLAPHVRVNAVSPGMIEADWEADWNIPAGHLDEAIGHTPLRRLGQPEEIAQTVVYLASAGGGYTTGQILQVDGGWVMPG